MDGYSVTEAASVLGVPTERVWELLARGVLSGTPDGETGMRVFLQPRPVPPAVNEAPPGNGHGRARETDVEASPFRELLTEFRNLTERYGQALLALGEARGEVASLRSRVDVLEARMDLRLPMGGETGWTQPPPQPRPPVPELRPTERPAEPPERAAPAPLSEAEAAVDVGHEAEPVGRRKRGRPHFSDDFAEALARAEDPNPAVLPGADEAGAAFAALQQDRAAAEEGPRREEEPLPGEVEMAEAAYPRELPAAEPISVEEYLPEADAVVEAAPEPRPEAEAEAIAEAEPMPEVAPEPVPEPELEREVEPMLVPEPEPEVQIEPVVDAVPVVEGTPEDADLEALAAPEAGAGAHVESPVQPDLEPAAQAGPAVPQEEETEERPEPDSVPEPTPESAGEFRTAADVIADVEPLAEPEAMAEPDARPEPIVEVAPPGEPEEDLVAAAEPQPEPEARAKSEPAPEPEPAPEVEAVTGAAQPQPQPAWDQERYTTEIGEPDWWTPEDSVWSEPVVEPATAPSPEQALAAEQTADEGAATEEPATPETAAPTETHRGEETMLWYGHRPQPSEPAGWPVEDAAGEMEVASTGRRDRGPTASAGGLPGADELDEALASLDAGAPHRGTLDDADDEESRAPQAHASESAFEPSRPNQTPVVSAELRSPASRAYRRLRRIFPG